MSTKTLRKRIALVAVSAMGFGLLTSVTANASNVTMQQDALWISTTASTTGGAVAPVAGAATNAATTAGWIADTSTVAATSASGGLQVTGGSAKTASVYSGAQISVVASNGSTVTNGVSIVVTGGTLDSITTTGGSTVVNGTRTVVASDSGAGTQIGAKFTVSAAVGATATIAAYTGSGITGVADATAGNLIGIWTLTVASASSSGVYSSAESTITQQACIAKSGTPAGSNAYDTTSKCRNGYAAVIYFDLEDGLGVNLTSGTIAAQVTSGTVNAVAAASAAAGDAYVASTAFDTYSTTTGLGYVVVNQPTANTAGSSTVTLMLDGAVIATKTVSWEGDAASITVSTDSNSSFIDGASDSGNTNVGAAGVIYIIKDAAGNAINFDSQPTVTDLTGSMVNASLSTSTGTGVAAVQTSSRGYGYSTMIVNTSSLNGAGSYTLKITNSAGATIKSAVQNVTVSNGSTNSFAVSWDKASYAPGDIATLTIQIKDAYGNAMGAGSLLTGLDLTVNTSGFTAVGTACTATTAVDSNGKATCKYAAGNTEGAYSYSVDLTTATAQSASVGALSIKSASATVTNAEVLAAIVKLIASINKQIAALQKALKK
jgi:hypothetical protein